MIKLKKNDKTNLLSFCAHQKLKLVRGGHFEYQYNLEKGTCTSPYVLPTIFFPSPTGVGYIMIPHNLNAQERIQEKGGIHPFNLGMSF